MMVEGVKFLMATPPDEKVRNIYYFYYATQVIHNCMGYEWDTWNPGNAEIADDYPMPRDQFLRNGSWDPLLPARTNGPVKAGG